MGMQILMAMHRPCKKKMFSETALPLVTTKSSAFTHKTIATTKIGLTKNRRNITEVRA